MEQLKLHDQPIAAGAPSSPGNASIWASKLASAPRVDRQWAYNGTTCARLGPVPTADAAPPRLVATPFRRF